MNLADEIAALARRTVPELRERYARRAVRRQYQHGTIVTFAVPSPWAGRQRDRSGRPHNPV